MTRKIVCWDGRNKKFERDVPNALTSSEIRALLLMLYAQELTIDEIISGNLRKNQKGHSQILEIREEKGALSIGENPFITAKKA